MRPSGCSNSTSAPRRQAVRVEIVQQVGRIGGRVGFGERAAVIFKHRQQQARADAEIFRDDIDQFDAAMRAVDNLFGVRFQPAGPAVNEVRQVESDLGRAVDE